MGVGWGEGKGQTGELSQQDSHSLPRAGKEISLTFLSSRRHRLPHLSSPLALPGGGPLPGSIPQYFLHRLPWWMVGMDAGGLSRF